jgi:hypothetical protein
MNKTNVLVDSLGDIKDTYTRNFIKISLAIDAISDDYQIKMTPTEAMEFVKHSGSFNRCCKSNLVRLIQRIGKFLPKKYYGPGNPNNGCPTHYFYIGNEGSRVIYVTFSKCDWVIQDAMLGGKRLNKTMQKFAKEARADESMETSANFEYKFRFWWD